MLEDNIFPPEDNKDKGINFKHPDPVMLHAQVGTFLIKFLGELNRKGAISLVSGPGINDTAEKVDAIVDIYSDKFIEILRGERPFNW